LAVEWIAEEADCEILSRCEHAVSVGRVWLVHRPRWDFTHWDSVRNTGRVLDSVKFWAVVG
jgi:hypothetical protein